MSSRCLKRACSDDGGVKNFFLSETWNWAPYLWRMDLNKMWALTFNTTQCVYKYVCVFLGISSWIPYVHFPAKLLSAFDISCVSAVMGASRHTLQLCVFFQMTLYRSASCYIMIAFLTLLFTPLDRQKIAPLWILHHSGACGALMPVQMDFVKLTFSKSLSRFTQY